MAFVLSHGQKRLQTSGRQVPAGPFAIDLSNPLTANLIACFLPGLAAGVNFAGACTDLVVAGSPKYAVTADGPAMRMDTAAARLNALAPPSLKNYSATDGGGLTILWRGTGNGSAAVNWTALIGVTYDNAGNSPYASASLLRISGTTGVRIHAGSGGGSLNTDLSSVDLTANTLFTLACTFTPGGACQSYVNGVANVSVSTFPATPDSTATSQLVIGYDAITAAASQNAMMNADTNIACVWRRVLTAAEIALLSLAPYSFFLPLELELSALNAGAPATAPVVYNPWPQMAPLLGQ